MIVRISGEGQFRVGDVAKVVLHGSPMTLTVRGELRHCV